MKICFVSSEYVSSLLGRAGVHAKNIFEELAKLGHEVQSLTTNTENKLTTYMENGASIYRIPTVNKSLLEFASFSLNLKKYYKRISSR